TAGQTDDSGFGRGTTRQQSTVFAIDPRPLACFQDHIDPQAASFLPCRSRRNHPLGWPGGDLVVIIVLSLTSAIILGSGILRYAWLVRGAEDGPTAAMMVWILIVWWAVSLVPALCAAGLTAAWFGDLSGMTRMIGLAPIVLLLLPIPTLVAFLTWEYVTYRLECARRARPQASLTGFLGSNAESQGPSGPGPGEIGRAACREEVDGAERA